jgi:nondiscriminating glutamyl-tRNA synthetase
MINSNDLVRVRFAPSPSGFLHIGGARSALFNYLFAKKRGGKFIVRIDDTDALKSTNNSIRSILADLKWLGLDWDHGLDADTLLDTDADGPYRASNRKDIYLDHAKKLIDLGHAYHFTDPVDGSRAIKFKAPKSNDIVFFDDIRGKITTPKDTIDDFVIIRSNGMATYNFATVIDDYLMGITHVYRADDHIPNTPKQILLYNAFNWKIPKFGHMALIFGSDRSKLSKRHGSASIDDFRKRGYTRDALINYISMLGWGHPKSKDIFSFTDLIDLFSIKKVSPSPAMFDIDKLNFINSHYLKSMGRDNLIDFSSSILKDAGINVSNIVLNKGVDVFSLGWTNGSDIIKDFSRILSSDIDDDGFNYIKTCLDSKIVIDNFKKNDLDMTKTLSDLRDKILKKDLMWTLRILLIGTPHGPAVDILRDLVDKSIIIGRINRLGM